MLGLALRMAGGMLSSACMRSLSSAKSDTCTRDERGVDSSVEKQHALERRACDPGAGRSSRRGCKCVRRPTYLLEPVGDEDLVAHVAALRAGARLARHHAHEVCGVVRDARVLVVPLGVLRRHAATHHHQSRHAPSSTAAALCAPRGQGHGPEVPPAPPQLPTHAQGSRATALLIDRGALQSRPRVQTPAKSQRTRTPSADTP